VAGARKAALAHAYGADYVANSCASSGRREGRNRRFVRDPLLNELATDPISPLEYDAFILESGKEPDDPLEQKPSNSI
jgi:hypothetical protein